MIKKISNLDEIKNLFMLSNYIIKKDIYNSIYGYYYDNKLIAFIDYSIIYDRCELNYIEVLDNYKNKGIAQELMDFMFENCHDLKNITLEVNTNNLVALKLYNKNKFKNVATRKNYYQNEDAYLMEKKLVN